MNYLVSKPKDDSRITVCGFIIPNGFFVVMGLTFENQRQLKNVRSFGYDVTPTDLPEGTYTPQGRRVDKWSVRDWALGQGDLVYLDGPAPEDPMEALRRDEIRPPDVSLRPAHMDIEEVELSGVQTVLPPGVAAAKAFLEKQSKTVAIDKRDTADDEMIPAEDDMTTLAEAGATDELTMLRAALDARNIPYSPQAKVPALKKKLEQADAA